MAAISGFNNRKSNSVDMCSGPLAKQMIIFAIPLIISGILQLVFHATDLIVIGRFASKEALAAVGATASLTHLLVNIFVGLSVGTNVLVARYIGEHNRRDISRTVHTAVMTSIIAGVLLAICGIALARPVLTWMATPPEVLDKAVLYMSIYFGGMPVIMLYNFSSAIMQAMGDTAKPFIFLMIGGIANVLLNLFFVLVFKWDVAGVATATVFAQAIAAVLVLRELLKMRGPCRVKWQMLRIEWKNLREMIGIGVPAGFQSSCFSLSNILIQSSINTFGSAAVAGNVAFCSVENFAHAALYAITQTVTTFVSCNYGGKQYDRLKKSISVGMTGAISLMVIFGVIMMIWSRKLMGIFSHDPEVVRWGILRAYYIIPFLFIAAIMQLSTGAMRGLGHSTGPSLISIFCICIFRVIWVFTFFRWFHNMDVLLINYPVSWLLNAVLISWLLRYTLKKKGILVSPGNI